MSSLDPQTQQDYQRLQRILDVIGNTPGSILVRGPDMWIALPPGNVGDVLVIDVGGIPAWVDPTTVGL